MHIILATALTALIAVIAGGTQIATQMGAHPWWASQVVMVGAPIGIILGLLLWALRLKRLTRVFLGVIALAVTFGVAKYGQIGFANSYAEDQFAGQLWYFGWLATSSAASVLVMASARSKVSTFTAAP